MLDEGLRANMDLINERRVTAHLRSFTYKKAVAKLYNLRVYPRRFRTSELILCKTKVNDPTRARGKLAPRSRVIPRSSLYAPPSRALDVEG
ncbi:hypothetical protein BHM03_00047474 [Ensete ventricosum]|nr:hypothetical protein BHM03_00047474 [Ensete ventricosum]